MTELAQWGRFSENSLKNHHSQTLRARDLKLPPNVSPIPLPLVNLASTDTASLYVLVYRLCNEDDVVVVALFPRGISPLAASEEATPCRSQPSRLDSQSIGKNL